MKLSERLGGKSKASVAPLAGARIEIVVSHQNVYGCGVAPLAGARIEITMMETGGTSDTSLPSRERGLKSVSDLRNCSESLSLPSRERGLKFLWWLVICCNKIVAPLAGARIEMSKKLEWKITDYGRSPRGSAD